MRKSDTDASLYIRRSTGITIIRSSSASDLGNLSASTKNSTIIMNPRAVRGDDERRKQSTSAA